MITSSTSMSSPKVISLWILSLIFTFCLGYFISLKTDINQQNTDEDIQITRKNFSYKYINPILECDTGIQQNNNLDSLKKIISNFIDDQTNQQNISFASIYFRDLNNGPWFGINEKEYFSPASLIKVPVLITYLKKAEINPEILQKKITNIVDSNSGSNTQNIKPSVTIEANKEYSIEELLQRMIVYSDNDAYNDLVKNLDPDETNQIYQDLDINISKAFANPNGDIITVKDYASFFRILFNASYLDQDMSEKALSLLTQVEYKKALVAGVPDTIAVAHKFGERKYLDSGEIQFHDCGIIYLPQKPYLLCVMTRSKDIDKSIQFIKNISKKVFNYINTNN